MTNVLFRRRPVRTRTWIIAFAMWSAVAVIPSIVQGGHGFLVDAFAYAITWGLPFAIVVLTLYSKNRYGTVTITPATFRVGRHEIDRSLIDLDALRAIDNQTPGAASRIITSSNEIDIPVAGLRAGDLGKPPIFGGAWGTPFGDDSFVIHLHDGRAFTVPVPHGSRGVIFEHLLG